ncbi:MAG: hypothetical protein ABIQ22_14140 [Arthrobacter oryzae]
MGEGGDFGEAFGRVFAPEDVDGGEGEFGAGAAEPCDVRGAGELSLRVCFEGREDDFPDQAGRLNPLGVVEEGEAFAVPGGSLGHVGGDDPPNGAEEFEQEPQRRGVAADFLQGDDVKPGNHLGNARHGVPVAFGGVAGAGGPFVRQVPEGPDVPGRDQEVRRRFRRHGPVQGSRQPGQVLRDFRGSVDGHALHTSTTARDPLP